MNRKTTFLLLLLTTTLVICQASQDSFAQIEIHNKEAMDTNTPNNIMTVSGLIVKKEFIKKNRNSANFEQLYFRLSRGDFFIKFCESNVTQEELENHLNQPNVPEVLGDKSVTLEVKIINGAWDICPGEFPEAQSRIGEYVIIHRIVR